MLLYSSLNFQKLVRKRMKRIAPVVHFVSLKNAFEDKKTLLITRQALYLINLLVVAKLILILHLLF